MRSVFAWQTANRPLPGCGKSRWWLAAGLWLLLACVLAAPASAIGFWDPNIRTAAQLQAGESIDSEDGWFTFSDFHFGGVGFDEEQLDEYLVQPQDSGFKLILGFGELFGPGSLEMFYTATAKMSHQIDAAEISLVALYDATDADPLVEVGWEGSNGAMMETTATGPPSFPFPGVSTSFDPISSLMVRQVVTLSTGSGVVKVQNGYSHTKLVPEPGSGLLVASGLGLATVATTRRARRRRGRESSS
jgi:hypothetical protein